MCNAPDSKNEAHYKRKMKEMEEAREEQTSDTCRNRMLDVA
jgi:hypothetical protein